MASKRHKHKQPKPAFQHPQPGALPGTFVVDPKAPCPHVRLLAFGPDACEEKTITDLDEIQLYLNAWPVVWVDVDGLGDVNTIRHLGQIFGLHPLAMEDVVHVHQRAKVEVYGDQLFVVARMMSLDEHLHSEQLSMFVGENFLLSFQEDRPGDCLETVRRQIRNVQGRVRHFGPDYLAYTLLDAVVDCYFPILEHFGDRLETLEDEVMLEPKSSTILKIHDIKHDLRTLRRAVWPERDAISMLLRDTLPVIKDDTRIYLRDCYDHSVQVIDLLETYRELCADLMDVYLSSVSNRMNEVMRVLTIISTIFIPLSFVASVYGMNFNTAASPWNMPELNMPYGYPSILAFMSLMVLSMYLFFQRRGWLHSFTNRLPIEANGNGKNGNGAAGHEREACAQEIKGPVSNEPRAESHFSK